MTSETTITNPFETTPAAVFLRRQVELLAHRKTQKQIAHETGFASANFITMLKSGASKIPLDRVPALARSLETDPTFLMRLALEQAVERPHQRAGGDLRDADDPERAGLAGRNP